MSDEQKIILELTAEEAHHTFNALARELWEMRYSHGDDEASQQEDRAVHGVWRRLGEAKDNARLNQEELLRDE